MHAEKRKVKPHGAGSLTYLAIKYRSAYAKKKAYAYVAECRCEQVQR